MTDVEVQLLLGVLCKVVSPVTHWVYGEPAWYTDDAAQVRAVRDQVRLDYWSIDLLIGQSRRI